MAEHIDWRARRAFYEQHIQRVLLPFWLRTVDAEFGGIFNCFDNEGRHLLSEDKYTWSQGRMVWVWSKLAQMPMFSAAERARFLDLAGHAAGFLMRHALLPNGHCAFLLSRDGVAKPVAPGVPLDSSIFADFFVVWGLARYAQAAGDPGALEFARRLHATVTGRIASGDYLTAPDATPAGYRAHSIPMIQLVTAQEITTALHVADDPAWVESDALADRCVEQTFGFVAPDNTLHELITTDGRFVATNLLGRYSNPGHTIEDMWFVLHQARAKDDPQTIARAVRVLKRALQLGWDEQHGGLFLFVDQDGGAPKGSAAGLENETMTRKLQADWANKLWWTHSEALYATLLGYRLTGDEGLLARYQQMHDYTFRAFPNTDTTIGEWIQIRDRLGRPEQKVVALPVKDPMHILRSLALCVDLLAEMEA
jgi:N-acylglucosamine 2-epimerase